VPTLRFDVLDVFTDTPFTGNQLAVVHGADELSTEQLRTIAAEFGYA
jgi:trans-2,3-dihydro-3-hydroxyanthranilate isomerase